MSVAKDLVVQSASLTPNPVVVEGAVLASIGIAEQTHTWAEYAPETWASIQSITWGAA